MLFQTHFGEPVEHSIVPAEASDCLPQCEWFAKTFDDPPLPPQEEIVVWIRRYLQRLISCAGHGINYLLNTGPLPDGSLQSLEIAILRGMGDWLAQHEQTLMGTRKSRFIPGQWGYAVDSGNTTWLHIVDTTDTMTGIPDWRFGPAPKCYLKKGLVRPRIELYCGVERPRSVVHRQSGRSLPFRVANGALSIDLRGVAIDPIDTIIEIIWE